MKLRQLVGAAFICLSIAGAASAGSFVSPGADPFYLSTAGFGIPGAGTTCFPTVCASDLISSNFNEVSKTFVVDNSQPSGYDEILDTTATFTGVLYPSVPDGQGGFTAGSPAVGFSTQGDVDFVFYGRASDTTGTWNAQMTLDNTSVTADGHTISLTLDPTSPTDGTLAVTPILSGGGHQGIADQSYSYNVQDYDISLSFDSVNILFTVDPTLPGGFSNVPVSYPLELVDTATLAPEPGTPVLLALGVPGLIALKLRLRPATTA